MNASIHDTLNLLRTVIACIGVIGVVVFVNYAFSRENLVNKRNKVLNQR